MSGAFNFQKEELEISEWLVGILDFATTAFFSLWVENASAIFFSVFDMALAFFVLAHPVNFIDPPSVSLRT